jgi:hypothetical protein
MLASPTAHATKTATRTERGRGGTWDGSCWWQRRKSKSKRRSGRRREDIDLIGFKEWECLWRKWPEYRQVLFWFFWNTLYSWHLHDVIETKSLSDVVMAIGVRSHWRGSRDERRESVKERGSIWVRDGVMESMVRCGERSWLKFIRRLTFLR